MLIRFILPPGCDSSALTILAARALRAFADGYVSVLLPAYLLALGMGGFEVGFLSTATLMGSASMTILVGAVGHRFPQQRLLVAASILMCATGIGFASFSAFLPLTIVAFLGTLNPSSSDVSIFLPLEHARLAGAASKNAGTALFSRYSLLAYLFSAMGALASGIPGWLDGHTAIPRLSGLRMMFWAYAAIGFGVWLLYRRIGVPEAEKNHLPAPLGPSRGVVMKLAALFSIDAFAGGFVVNSLLSLWFFERFGMSPASVGIFFFASSLLTAASQLAAPRIAERFGLVNTMVYTHIASSICLILAAVSLTREFAFGLLLFRSALSQLDVPTRSAFLMSLVSPGERPAAASFTAVPRSLAAALSPVIGGAMLAGGLLAAPLIAAGALKVAYDLTLLAGFKRYEDKTK